MGVIRNASRFLRQAKRALNGKALSELDAVMQSRFSDLKSRLDSDWLDPFPLHHSSLKIRSAPRHDGDAICVASAMPPDKTGIATATLLTFREASYGVDIFAPYDCTENYLLALKDARLNRGPVSIHHLAARPLAVSVNHYMGQLFVLGNSEHNFPIIRSIRRMSAFPACIPIAVHIHDPCLLHLVRLVARSENRDFSQWLQHKYRLPKPLNQDTELLNAGVYGIKALLDGVNVKLALVNSKAAQEAVERELPNVRVERLFHPVFILDKANSPPRSAPFQIGSFGVPNSSKGTDIIIDAFERLRRSFPRTRLLLAGWGAERFATRYGLSASDGYDIYESPDDDEFDRLLMSVDVAVQLRTQTHGESSGVIARLIGADVPVIASRIGAFSELNDIVQFLEPGDSADELAHMLERAINLRRKPSYSPYRDYHTPQLFCARLLELFKSMPDLAITPTTAELRL
jgi:glycosyltransferase involved in cell wall biosynthesis